MKQRFPLVGPAAGHVSLLLCTLAVIWGVVGLHLREEYQRALRDAERATATLARELEDDIARKVAVLDNATVYARPAYLADPGRFNVASWYRDKAVLRAILLEIAIADAHGTVVQTSAAGRPEGAGLAEREHFRVHAAGMEDRFFVGLPLPDPATGRLAIPFSRRIATPDGTFAGVVSVSAEPAMLGGFRRDVLMEGGFAILAGRDGVIREAWPDASLIGETLDSPRVLAVGDSLGGPLRGGAATRVGRRAVVSQRNIGEYQLMLTVGLSADVALAPFRAARGVTVPAGVCLSLIALILGAVTIHHRRRLTRFHEALSLTMDNISQGILMLDANRRMPVVNRRVAELLGLPVELASLGADFDAMLDWQRTHGEFDPVANDDAPLAAAILHGDIGRHPPLYERTRPNGTVLEIRTTALPRGGAVRTYTDITERKRIERELATARDAAEAGARTRAEFLAVMSHEIRTPLNGITGAAGLLRDMPLGAEQRDYVRIIRESGDHLSVLIQDILDFSRLDAGRLELEEIAFDPRALVQGTIDILGGQARSKSLSLVARTVGSVPDRVGGDPARLRQVLINLISNGIKFTETGGVTVEIRMTTVPQGVIPQGVAPGDVIPADAAQYASDDGGAVALEIAVSDTGIGIDPAARPKLFSPFTQVDSSISRRFGGTGLGLVICSRLVALMGGAIEVDSIPGLGSTFRFTVRLRRLPAEAAAPAVSAPAAARPLKILLAEDIATNRHVAIRLLTRLGHAVDAVEDGARAIAAAAVAEYDVILMDMMMPEVDGIAATRLIRAGTSPRRDVPIIGLTANALASDREACEAAGMNGFLTKPVTGERLRAALESIVPHAAASVAPLPVMGLPGPPLPFAPPQPPSPAGGNEPPDASPLASGEAPPEGEPPLLDEAFLEQLAGEIGRDGVAEVLQAFLEEGPPRLDAIRAAQGRGAIVVIRREAHALAGAARNVGLVRLGEAAYALQRAAEGTGPGAAAVEALGALLRDSLPLAAAWSDAAMLTPLEG